MDKITENSQEEVSVPGVNEKQIKSDFMRGLLDAEVQSTPTANHPGVPVPDKLKLNVPNVVAKLICDIKNGIAAKVITKDMDEDTKEFVRDFLKTQAKEIELYKTVLDQVGTDLTPEEYKEFINKWLCSPLILIIEFELERALVLRNSLKELTKKLEKKGEK